MTPLSVFQPASIFVQVIDKWYVLGDKMLVQLMKFKGRIKEYEKYLYLYLYLLVMLH